MNYPAASFKFIRMAIKNNLKIIPECEVSYYNNPGDSDSKDLVKV